MRNRIFVRIICAALILASLVTLFSVIANAYIISFAKKYILERDELENYTVDCVMVLGAGLWNDKPSPMLRERLDLRYLD